MTLQRYFAGDAVWEAETDPATPVYLAGPHMYAIGTVGGELRSFGAAHIVGKMGGAWAHPLRALHGWSLVLESAVGPAPLAGAPVAELHAGHVTRRYAAGPLAVAWTEFVAEDAPALLSLVQLENRGPARWEGALVMRAEPDLRGCWFSGWGPAELTIGIGETLTLSALNGPYAGRAAAVACSAGAPWELAEGLPLARLPLALDPGAAREVAFCLYVAHQDAAQAPARAQACATRAAALLAEKVARYERLDGEVTIETPEPFLDQAWLIARRNTCALGANYPDLPPYLLAGLPEYPQLFGCDNAYNAPGALAGGFAPIVRSTLAALAAYGQRACGRIPHEITTNGRVFHPGNTQETPQFAVACWDYLRWTGDLEFARQVYPLCAEGLEHFAWTLAGGPYPAGDGVVERPGMGACKLDSTCYLHQALGALHELALALGRTEDAEEFARHAARLAERFERDWWLEAEELYADSLHLDGRPQLDGHWTVAIPLQTGLATPERAARALARIEAEWVNEWGLVHTRGVEPRVWTLPTGLLALAAFRHGRPELGLHLLRNIAVTARHGTLGTLKELIPAGLCFVQLWSAGLYMQGLVEGLLGVRPRAHRRELAVAPQLPAGWPAVELRGLPVGEHRLALRATPGTLEVEHIRGPAPLTVRYRAQEPGAAEVAASVAPGERVVLGAPG
ncbi:MAG TPA: glycosyl hydrolase family 65 protein [Roseiflexaceae bacterium]|nr:glycosyl hydrolase family 65 protein [Roseiflexaceae bacterium]